ncbi:hypothetical protein D2Q93_11340 [Alicyclobacillaceae bacterium I2511]|nr:hypothetical protein D2Q93_11340 [Alicyclobacillaceae bacterium I2511]
MCEILLLKSKVPFLLSEVFPYAEVIEQYGLDGFGWGISWLEDSTQQDSTQQGSTLKGSILKGYRSKQSLKEDWKKQAELAEVATQLCLFHLRRPSYLHTIAAVNSQPYVRDGLFAYAHNGYLENNDAYRSQCQGQLQGVSDSEVGFCLFSQLVDSGVDPQVALQESLRLTLGGGTANVVVMTEHGQVYATGQNSQNHLFAITGKGFEGLVTELHSPDDFLFKELFPWMTKVRLIEGVTTL